MPVAPSMGIMVDRSRCAILIISSIISGILLLGILLAGRGFGIVATNGKGRTLSRTIGTHPSLVLLSIVVPRVGNFRITRQLGTSPRARRVPVVFLATLGAATSVIGNFGMNTGSFVSGPFGGRRLIVHIARRVSLVTTGQVVVGRARRLHGVVVKHSGLCSIVTRSLHSPVKSVGVILGVLVLDLPSRRVNGRVFSVLDVTGRDARSIFSLLSGLLG